MEFTSWWTNSSGGEDWSLHFDELSIYERVSTGRETLNNIVGLIRVGPSCETEAVAELSKQALSHYKSRYGERFCTSFWKPGYTSNTITKLKAKKWNWYLHFHLKVRNVLCKGNLHIFYSHVLIQYWWIAECFPFHS